MHNSPPDTSSIPGSRPSAADVVAEGLPGNGARAEAPGCEATPSAADGVFTESHPSRDEDRRFWFLRDEVAGTLAMWAIRQSPYLIPDGLTAAVQAMHDSLPDEIGGMFSLSYEDLRDTIERLCLTIPEIVAWNTPKSGHGATLVFSSRYEKPAADDDFIDLHALANNICRSVMADQEVFEGFSDSAAIAPKGDA